MRWRFVLCRRQNPAMLDDDAIQIEFDPPDPDLT